MITALFMMGMAFFACDGDTECSEEVSCSFGAVCIEGECITKSCSTSSQCPMAHFCDDGTCAEGCADEYDCYPGDSCTEEGTCEAKDCRDTHLDCGFKEFCNEFSGECYDAGGYYCRTCNDDNDCGGNGNYCTSSGYCGVTCETNNDCPSGFQCYAFVNSVGEVQFYQCYTACWVYADKGGGEVLPGWPVEPVDLPTCELTVEDAG